MSVAPSPSSGRGEVVLQPAYFTSWAFVDAARADVDRLLQQYSQEYARGRERPFALFKEVWHREGWTWIQFKVFDTRSRAAFLRVALRLFSERLGGGETPLNRAAALFGLYTLFRTQPSTAAPMLHSVGQIEMTSDVYREMLALPDALHLEFFHPVRPHVIYVQSDLLEAHAFQVLPHGEMHPLSPRALPREVVVEEDGEPKKGRPSKRDRTRRAREALEGGGTGVGGSPADATRGRYRAAKQALVEGRLRDARGEVAERVHAMGGSSHLID